ncbi:MAG: DUF4270 family protein, partial [Bacteroidota bacterium]|nr:DUF4270 family protein [Bacteroidota bacterium]
MTHKFFKTRVLYNLLFSLFIFITLQFVACDNETKFLDTDMLDHDEIAIKRDTSMSLSAYILSSDSILTGNSYASKSLLGNIVDPVFGNIRADFLTQLQTTSLGQDFGEGASPDSLVLSLVVSDIYGEINKNQNIKVYSLNKDLSYSDTYYSDINIDTLYSEDDLISTETRFFEDSLITVKLSLETASYLMDGDTMLNSLDYFYDYFKGIYCTTDTTDVDGAIKTIDLISSNSNVKLFYHNIESDSLDYTFNISTSSGRFNHYTHSYESAEFSEYVCDTTYADSLSNKLYMQGLGGVTSRFSFNEIEEYLDDNKYSINKAELILPVIKDKDFDIYSPPSRLLLYK